MAAAAVLTATTAAVTGTGVASADTAGLPGAATAHRSASEDDCRSDTSPADAVIGDVFGDMSSGLSAGDSDDEQGECTFARSDDGDDTATSSDSGSTRSHHESGSPGPSAPRSTSASSSSARNASTSRTPASHRAATNPLDAPPPPGTVRTIKLPSTTGR